MQAVGELGWVCQCGMQGMLCGLPIPVSIGSAFGQAWCHSRACLTHHRQQHIDPSTLRALCRPLPVFGYDDAPHGHAECDFEDVRVPGDSMILGGYCMTLRRYCMAPGWVLHWS